MVRFFMARQEHLLWHGTSKEAAEAIVPWFLRTGGVGAASLKTPANGGKRKPLFDEKWRIILTNMIQ